MPQDKRVIMYVDGFNLYFGLMDSQLGKYRWLDIRGLSESLLKPGQVLVEVKYFTSLVSSTPKDPTKNRRQITFLEALGTLPDFHIFYGHFLQKEFTCYTCGNKWLSHEEKMTDVNIATELLTDAFQDRFDVALLLPGDSDVTSPVERVRTLFPEKRIIIAFPPARDSVELRKAANGYIKVGEDKLRDNQPLSPTDPLPPAFAFGVIPLLSHEFRSVFTAPGGSSTGWRISSR